MPRQTNNREREAIRCLLDKHLKRRAMFAPQLREHPDEDSLATFVEGRLSEAESKPIISHLVACAPCRHFTARLIRLESELGEGRFAQAPAAAMPPNPGRLWQFLSSMAARLNVSFDEEAFEALWEKAKERNQADQAGEGGQVNQDRAKRPGNNSNDSSN
jgi:hypothetical protein